MYLRAIFQVQAPGGAYIWRGDLTEDFLRYRFGGLIFGGPYFRNFTVARLRAKSETLVNILIVYSNKNHVMLNGDKNENGYVLFSL